MNSNISLFGQSVRAYVDAAEWPVVVLVASLSLFYLLTFWFSYSYLGVVQPVVFMLEVLVVAVTAFRVGVQGQANWRQLALTSSLIGVAAGLVSALWALVRFAGVSITFTASLFFNLVTEPVWSGLLAVAVSLLTLWFFQLPRLTAGWFSEPSA